ncbi:MAG: UDP-N-acetylmuramoyl-tripeptide--D-alanyl-D-alanine ligase [Rhodobacteraceae bacterium]|nr:UDP-N-acetylmuramoyl-tripeptide--D-alanyl-D-alanine ligase [Paracoccaceae bacterium]MCY4141046.1 UDP-N-acetylmuramoyl-tripeptide--D-alanyl-D-alanine ligase [Paracoccaceae bacterium]
MSSLWTFREAERATGGTSTRPWRADDVSIDTRRNIDRAIFFAIIDRRDGHEFIDQAFRMGAAAAIVSRIPPDLPKRHPLLLVEDTVQALGSLGAAARRRAKGIVIGVTGSVGKTGTKDMIRTVLDGQGIVHAAERSFNNHLGVPLTLARMPRDATHTVVEIGMNRPGEITPLARLADLDVALVTTVAPVHMAAFDNLDDIARAKAEIFSGLRPAGSAIINRDQETFGILEAAANDAGATVVTFGRSDRADFHLVSVETDELSTVVTCRARGRILTARLSALVPHLALNLLGVLAVVDAVGLDLGDAVDALPDWQVPDGRGNRFRVRFREDNGGVVEIIDESYNANPTSMSAALESLASAIPGKRDAAGNAGRRVAILGDMLELGVDEERQHAQLARHPALEQIDSIHTVGNLMRSLHDALPKSKRGEWHEDADRLAGRISELLAPGDVAMLKGSAGTMVGKVVEAIRCAGLERGRRRGSSDRRPRHAGSPE